MTQSTQVRFGREVCGDLDQAETREWLVTNGLGGFASGTIGGTATRRYHGLLIAALQPPGGRTLLVSGLDEIVNYQGHAYALASNRWLSGIVSPKGFLHIESFRLEGTTPTWRYALGDAVLEKRVWMKRGENTTYVEYALVRGGSATIQAKVLVGYRDFHGITKAGEREIGVSKVEKGAQFSAGAGTTPFSVRSETATIEPRGEWYRDYLLPEERARGLEDHEDRFYGAEAQGTLKEGETLTLVFSTEADATLAGAAASSELADQEWKVLDLWQRRHAEACRGRAEDESGWLWQLALAADQFLVERKWGPGSPGKSVIAGYPWFGDWGRDTMIALPGLTLATGRAEIAREILRSFARFIDAGMLPNNFSDANGEPRYNSVDAALWYIEAVRQYFEATQDNALILELFPLLAAAIDAHVRGTRFGIKLDPADALLSAGTPEVQLTWMDAKVGDWVVTPRTGKPVEVNALWINALDTVAALASALGKPFEGYARLSGKARKNFGKFWNEERGYCYDVLDVPGGGVDKSLRPNQIFAVSLRSPLLDLVQQKAVVDAVGKSLVTSYGLRSLAPTEQAYKGIYAGGPRDRDSAYHQGTVWAWLLGPYALAHYRVYRDRAAAKSFLEPLGESIHAGGLGTIGEVFNGDEPHLPGGCFAQAWSVGELLRAWETLGAKEAGGRR